MFRSQLRRLAASAILAGALAVPASAFAEGGVRYSYEKVALGTAAEWVLVPHGVDGLKGVANSSEIRQAFEALRKDKRATYGNSGIAVSGSGSKAKVKVTIDPKVAQYALIIIAETVYTVTELGVDGVEFPGYAKGRVQREDVAFPAYTLTIPLWKAVGRDASPSYQVVMPNGDLVPSSEIASRWKSKDAGLRKDLFGYLKSDDVYTVTTVARLLPSLKIDYASEVIPLLKSDDEAVKKAALESLESERDDTKVLDAVVAFMEKEKSDALARAAAEFLDKAKTDKYSIQREFFLLDRGAQAERLIAAKELGSSKDSRVVSKLAGVLEDKDAGVARAAAGSLARLDADKEQIAALSNAKVAADIKLDIARDLAKDSSKESKTAGLLYLAENAQDYEASKAVAALGELKARAELEKLLTNKKTYLRTAAAEALVEVGSAESIDELAKAAKGDQAEEFENAGYQIMLKQPLKVVLDKTKDRNAMIQRMAYRAAGERAQKENAGSRAFGVLESGTKSSDPLVRGAAARAIGTYGNDAAAKILEPLVDDKSAAVRRDVAFGIGYLDGGKLGTELEKMLDDSDPGVQAAAAISLARRGEAGQWEKIKALTGSKSAQARAAALAALAKLVSRDDKRGVREVISKLSGGVSDKALEVRETAVRELGSFDDDSAVTSIALQLGAEEESMRIASIDALVRTKNRKATSLVANALNDESLAVREAAVEALVALKDPSAKSALEKRAKVEPNEDLADEMRKAAKKL